MCENFIRQSKIIIINSDFLCNINLLLVLEDGMIRTAYNLDLEADRTLSQMVLLVRAISVLEDRSGTATVTINVLDVNEHPPFCSPPVIM